jgi:L-ascorbate metabolism protein UlaG (beta-lactamase superfamily)
MIKPLLHDDALLAGIQRACADRDAFHIWWLGQSGFLLQWQDRHLLFDPYLSDSLTRKYAQTDKPHVRMTERVIAPERLDFIDVATSTHNHTDHLDAETLLPLFAANPGLDLVIPEANRNFVTERLKMPASQFTGLDAGQTVERCGFRIHAVPAAHEKIDRDQAGRCHYLGYVVEFGSWIVYHSGDTIRYDNQAELLSRWKIDLALLPINGAKPERRVAGNLNAAEAAQLARDIRARCTIPMHYDMFEFNTVDPAEFVSAARAQNIPHRVLRAGEHWSSREL